MGIAYPNSVGLLIFMYNTPNSKKVLDNFSHLEYNVKIMKT